MDQNESAERKKEIGSQTTFKGFGVEFTGPSWVAIVVVGAVIIGGAIYISNQGPGAGETAQEAATSTEETDTTEALAPAESDSEQPVADTAAEDEK